ncbi:MAG: Ribonuclease H [Microgenomates group bacterium GW2011_GWF2_45_18]|nr:MAG: Ribonuclease H [Microgenomates group bacterium GW2011_GWF1_44_10]KKU01871.1 MAG: Ribonuclease H [Microgenomates group bacterium GW2011_GWF2_45_18]OGJ41116.1 MAG: hypothetical protein A2378_04520 [Candidatus Pacebacteria bacterium RIFOXYB1_FULL_44_10]HAU98812.1 ribonuclease H [Candidatus Paceibacterota bacterium]HAX01368.1 ribonuclease H [Candidatus Paceibacterota bacterium]
MPNYWIYTDGGSRGNPGNAGIGVIVFRDPHKKEVVFEQSSYIGVETNNTAEYRAVLAGMEWVEQLPHSPEKQGVYFYEDSQLVVEQLNKRYKINQPHLLSFAQRVWEMCQRLIEKNITISFQYVPREMNKEADRLVNQSLDAHRE